MKNKKIFIVIVCIILIGIVGLMLTSIGFVQSGRRISSKVIYEEKGDVNKMYIVSESIKEIDIKAKAIQFELRYSNSIEHIEIEIQNFYSDNDLKYEVNAGRLSISAMEVQINKIFGIGKQLFNYEPKLIVTLPSNYAFEKFSLHSKASDSQVEQIYAKFVSIASDAGRINIKKIEADSAEFENNTGKISVSELNATGNIKAINNVGEISIHLMNIEKYNYNAHNSVGSIKIGNEASGGISGRLNLSKGLSQTLDVENNVGSVSIF